MTSGKLNEKPSDKLVAKLAKRAKEHTQIIQDVTNDGKPITLGLVNKPSPSERRSKALRKKLRTRDGYTVRDDFKEPEPLKVQHEDCRM